jgi:hypothetical protein
MPVSGLHESQDSGIGAGQVILGQRAHMVPHNAVWRLAVQIRHQLDEANDPFAPELGCTFNLL